MSFQERSLYCRSPIGSRLFSLMTEKQSNLCVAVDTCSASKLLQLCNALGPFVALIKTHCDIISDWTPDVAEQLLASAKLHNFMIFEDRKFADIGATVQQQFSNGPLFIRSWTDVVTVHSIPGPGPIRAIHSASSDRPVGIFLLAQMSSDGNLATPEYSERTLQMALDCSDSSSVIGLITSGSIPRIGSAHFDPLSSHASSLIYATPGVSLDDKPGDALGQKYNHTPHSAIANGSDIVIVGRGILGSNIDSPSPLDIASISSAAQRYRDAAWKAYLDRIALA